MRDQLLFYVTLGALVFFGFYASYNGSFMSQPTMLQSTSTPPLTSSPKNITRVSEDRNHTFKIGLNPGVMNTFMSSFSPEWIKERGRQTYSD